MRERGRKREGERIKESEQQYLFTASQTVFLCIYIYLFDLHDAIGNICFLLLSLKNPLVFTIQQIAPS